MLLIAGALLVALGAVLGAAATLLLTDQAVRSKASAWVLECVVAVVRALAQAVVRQQAPSGGNSNPGLASEPPAGQAGAQLPDTSAEQRPNPDTSNTTTSYASRTAPGPPDTEEPYSPALANSAPLATLKPMPSGERLHASLTARRKSTGGSEGSPSKSQTSDWPATPSAKESSSARQEAFHSSPTNALSAWNLSQHTNALGDGAHLGSRLSRRDIRQARKSMPGNVSGLDTSAHDGQAVTAPVRRRHAFHTSVGRNNFAAIAAANRAVASVLGTSTSSTRQVQVPRSSCGGAVGQGAVHAPAQGGSDRANAYPREDASAVSLSAGTSGPQEPADTHRARRHSSDTPGIVKNPASSGEEQSEVGGSRRRVSWLTDTPNARAADSSVAEPAPDDSPSRSHPYQLLRNITLGFGSTATDLGTASEAPSPPKPQHGSDRSSLQSPDTSHTMAAVSMSGMVELGRMDLLDSQEDQELLEQLDWPRGSASGRPSGMQPGCSESGAFSFSGYARTLSTGNPDWTRTSVAGTYADTRLGRMSGMGQEGMPADSSGAPSPTRQRTPQRTSAPWQHTRPIDILNPPVDTCSGIARTSLPYKTSSSGWAGSVGGSVGIPEDIAASVMRGKRRESSNHVMAGTAYGSAAPSKYADGDVAVNRDRSSAQRPPRTDRRASAGSPASTSATLPTLEQAPIVRSRPRRSFTHSSLPVTASGRPPVAPAPAQTLLPAESTQTMHDDADSDDFVTPPPCTYDIMAAAFGWNTAAALHDTLDTQELTSTTTSVGARSHASTRTRARSSGATNAQDPVEEEEEEEPELEDVLDDTLLALTSGNVGKMIARTWLGANIGRPGALGMYPSHRSSDDTSSSRDPTAPASEPSSSGSVRGGDGPASNSTDPAPGTPFRDTMESMWAADASQGGGDAAQPRPLSKARSVYICVDNDSGPAPRPSYCGGVAARPSIKRSTLAKSRSLSGNELLLAPQLSRSHSDLNDADASSVNQDEDGSRRRLVKRAVSFRPQLAEDLEETQSQSVRSSSPPPQLPPPVVVPPSPTVQPAPVVSPGGRRRSAEMPAVASPLSNCSTNPDITLLVEPQPGDSVLQSDAPKTQAGMLDSTAHSTERQGAPDSVADAMQPNGKSPFESSPPPSLLAPSKEHSGQLPSEIGISSAGPSQGESGLTTAATSGAAQQAMDEPRSATRTSSQKTSQPRRRSLERDSRVSGRQSPLQQGHHIPHYSDVPAHRGRIKVLVVSVDSIKMHGVKEALPSKRYELQFASGSDCLRLVTSQTQYLPDVVLIDCHLGMLPAGGLRRRKGANSIGNPTGESDGSGSFASFNGAAPSFGDVLLAGGDDRHTETSTNGMAWPVSTDFPPPSDRTTGNTTLSNDPSLPSTFLPALANMDRSTGISSQPRDSVQSPIMAVGMPGTSSRSSASVGNSPYSGSSGRGSGSGLAALDLLTALRQQYDPSTLSIIMLASLTPPMRLPHRHNSAGGYPVQPDNSSPHSSLTTVQLAAHNTAAHEGVAGLMHGANDYMVLPVLPVELEARINMQVALRRASRLKAEASSSMQLLRAILPSHVIRKLKQGRKYIAQHHADVSIGFIDIVGFTRLSASWPSSKVAHMLNDLFSRFDDICERHGIYHVDTIGDGYMVLCGHDGETDHALKIVRAAHDMIEVTRQPLSSGEILNLRIGINTGPAHSGVLGTKRFKYTVWGDSVNCASRMESSGFPSCIQVSSSTYRSAMQSMIAIRNDTRSSSGGMSLAHQWVSRDWDSERGSRSSSANMGASSTGGAAHDTSSRLESARHSAATSIMESRMGSRVDMSLRSSRLSDTGNTLEFQFVSLGLREIKGKGLMHTYLVKVGGWQEAYQPFLLQRQQQAPTSASALMSNLPAKTSLTSSGPLHPGHSSAGAGIGPWDAGDVGGRLRMLHARIVGGEEDGHAGGPRPAASGQPPILPQPPSMSMMPDPHSLIGLWRSLPPVHATSGNLAPLLQGAEGRMYSDRASDLRPSSQMGSSHEPCSTGPSTATTHLQDSSHNTPNGASYHGLDALLADAWPRSSLGYNSSDFWATSGEVTSNGTRPGGIAWSHANSQSFSRESSQLHLSHRPSPRAYKGISDKQDRRRSALRTSDSAAMEDTGFLGISHYRPRSLTMGTRTPQEAAEALFGPAAWKRRVGSLAGRSGPGALAGPSLDRPATIQQQLESTLQNLLGPHCLDNLDPAKRSALVEWVYQQVTAPEQARAGLEPQHSGMPLSSATSPADLASRQSQLNPIASSGNDSPPASESIKKGLSSESSGQGGSETKAPSLKKVGSLLEQQLASREPSWSARGATALNELKAGFRSLVLSSGPSYTSANGSSATNRPNPFGREVRFAVAAQDLGSQVPSNLVTSNPSNLITTRQSVDASILAANSVSFAAQSSAAGAAEQPTVRPSAREQARKKNKSMSNLKALLKAAVKNVVPGRSSKPDRSSEATSHSSSVAHRRGHTKSMSGVSLLSTDSGGTRTERLHIARSQSGGMTLGAGPGLDSELISSASSDTGSDTNADPVQSFAARILGKRASMRRMSEMSHFAPSLAMAASMRSAQSQTDMGSRAHRPPTSLGSHSSRPLQFKLTAHGTLEPGISHDSLERGSPEFPGPRAGSFTAMSPRRVSLGGTVHQSALVPARAHPRSPDGRGAKGHSQSYAGTPLHPGSEPCLASSSMLSVPGITALLSGGLGKRGKSSDGRGKKPEPVQKGKSSDGRAIDLGQQASAQTVAATGSTTPVNSSMFSNELLNAMQVASSNITYNEAESVEPLVQASGPSADASAMQRARMAALGDGARPAGVRASTSKKSRLAAKQLSGGASSEGDLIGKSLSYGVGPGSNDAGLYHAQPSRLTQPSRATTAGSLESEGTSSAQGSDSGSKRSGKGYGKKAMKWLKDKLGS